MQNKKTARLGTAPEFSLLMKMSIPAMMGMLVQATYNIVDSIFVGHHSSLALSALSLCFPIQMIVMVVGVGIGVGSSSLISRTLGKRDNERANNVALHSFSLIIFFGVLTTILGGVGSRFILRFFVSDSQLLVMSEEYLRIVLYGSFFVYLPMVLNNILRAEGNTIVPMLTMFVGAFLNIGLDPLFIYGIGFFPAMGVKGAALATVISRIVNSLFILGVFYWGKNQISLKLKFFKFDWSIYKGIFSVGFPVCLMQLLGSFAMAGANKILSYYGTEPLAVLGLFYRLQAFILMPVYGLGQGLMPIIGYNFGHKKPERIVNVVKISFILGSVICFLGFLLMRFFPEYLLQMFGAGDRVMQVGKIAFESASYGTPFVAVLMLGGMVFQALGMGAPSLISTLIRQVVVLFPIMWFLSNKFGLNMLWFSIPISTFVAFAFMVGLLFFILPGKLQAITAKN